MSRFENKQGPDGTAPKVGTGPPVMIGRCQGIAQPYHNWSVGLMSDPNGPDTQGRIPALHAPCWEGLDSIWIPVEAANIDL